MARIFQLPRQVPIVGGTVSPGAKAYFVLTGTSTPAATYTDAALSTPHSDPVVADAAGVFPVVFLDPAVDYDLTIDDAADALIYEEPHIQDSIDALTQSEIGAVLFPISDAETSAGLVIGDLTTNWYYGDIRRYGATTTSTTNRAAVQASLNQYSHGGAPTFVPWGRWRCEGTVYGYYHVTNNPDFASADRLQAKVFIQGVGRIEVNHYNNSEYSGSVLQFTSGQLDIHDGHTTAARGSIMRDLVILNNDATAKTIRAYYTPSGTQWFNLFVANAGDGGQLDLQDIFNAEFMDIMAYGNGAGTGIKYDAVQAGGGNVTMVNVTSRNNAIDWDLGSAYDVARSNFIKNWTFKNCQGAGSPIHWRVRHGIGQATWENCWNEGATGVAGRGFAFSDMAGWQDAGSVNPGQLLLTGGGNYSDAATDSGFVHIEIGDDTATETTDGVGPITIQDVTLGQIGNNTIGIRVHNSTNAGPRVLSRINAHNNGGVFCALDDEVQIGPVIWENYDDSEYGYANHVTDTTGATDLRSRLSVYMDESYNIRPASESFSEKTITGGIAAVTALTHSIDTQADASSDDLDTLTGGIPGQTLILRAADSARTVVCKDGTGNLLLAGDFSLDNVEDRLYLHYDGVNYVEISRSDNGA